MELDSADAYSSSISQVTSGTNFSLNYYFYAKKENDYNRLQLSFKNEEKLSFVFDTALDQTGDSWKAVTVTCDDRCCQGDSPVCNGAVCVFLSVLVA